MLSIFASPKAPVWQLGWGGGSVDSAQLACPSPGFDCQSYINKPEVPALGRWRLEDQEGIPRLCSKASLGYIQDPVTHTQFFSKSNHDKSEIPTFLLVCSFFETGLSI